MAQASSSGVSTVTGEEVQLLILKLERARISLLSELPLVDLSQHRHNHDDGITNPTSCKKSVMAQPPKHWKQTESICRHLEHLGIISSVIVGEQERPRLICIELGCGTAKLSDYVSENLNGHCSHVLIDKKGASSFKAERLRDGSIRNRQKPHHRFGRLAADLQDKDLLANIILSDQYQSTTTSKAETQVAEDQNHRMRPTKFLAISKHLCGAAADYAIQGLENMYCASVGDGQVQKPPLPPPPLVVATCCHHRCHQDSFSNMDFFQHLGFTHRDFQVLQKVSQWFSIKIKRPDETKDDKGGAEVRYATLPPLPPQPHSVDLIPSPTLVPSEQFEREFTREEKAALGKRCKLALDTARGHALKRIGYNDVRFVRYTTLSLEDTLIIAI